MQQAVHSPPGFSSSYQVDTSDTCSLNDDACASMLERSCSEAIVSFTAATSPLSWPEHSPGSSSPAISLLGGEGKQFSLLAFFPEVAWVLALTTRAGLRTPKRYRAFITAATDCLKAVCLLVACWFFVAWVMGYALRNSLLTTLHQSVIIVLPIPFYSLALLSFVSAVVAWPRLGAGHKFPPPVISPRAGLRVKRPAQQDLEAAEFAHESCSGRGAHTVHHPLRAAIRVSKAAFLLWLRHEVYLMVSCLAGGFGMFCVTSIDAMLGSVLGPGDILVYTGWRTRRVSGAAAGVLFLAGSAVLTTGCLLGLLWAWIIAVLSWLSQLSGLTRC